ncbi:uncharacterized protein TRAVEDRAFT_46566 [Trametes versicolor FP-101664 SS1]|uniref:uncharacterized protein n=1 Tax=Trametes versicolor (strain FP-101664) TaxID=717944 RepID=UPI0004622CE2|nr:uncharacterized protein TRAVEDRAFT_46566 [Trametes versicolor FP-101664 SS1]EIW59257.1 hypothetical protein TRAVEDRAFT_46566 [Trametes versicolor FP-101664 SS1]
MSAAAFQQLPPHIWEYVCRELIGPEDDIWNTRENRIGCGTLAALARTCKSLHGPSLNVLWHTIPDIFVFFYALPRTCYRREQIYDGHFHEGHEYFSFKEPVQRLDLIRFFANAHRVRAVKAYVWHIPYEVSRYQAAPSAYDFLSEVLQSQPLLPNVQVVQHYALDSEDYPEILRSLHILFGPQLHTLHILGRALGRFPPLPDNLPLLDKVDSEDMIASLFSKVKDLSPGLRELNVLLDPSSRVIVAAVSSMICGLSHLTTVELSPEHFPITPLMFVHLALLPNLRVLRCSSNDMFWKEHDFGPLPYALPGRTFPMLQVLRLTAPTLHLPAQFLRFVMSPTFAEFTVTATAKVPRREIRPLFSALAALPSRDTFRTLSVNVEKVVRSDERTDIAPSPICNKTLFPLWGLRNLRDLCLDIHCPFDVDDALLCKRSRSWYYITRLYLNTSAPWGVYGWDAPVEDPSDSVNTSTTPAVNTSDEAEMGVNGDDGHLGHANEDGEAVEEDADGADDTRTGPMPAGWRKPRATLPGLVRFIADCRYLDSLGVEVNADTSFIVVSPRARRPWLGRKPYPTLSCLALGLSPIDDPYAVAAYLSHALRDIKEVESSWLSLEPDVPEHIQPIEREWWSWARKQRVRWEMVPAVLPSFAGIRVQEHRWRIRRMKLAWETRHYDR